MLSHDQFPDRKYGVNYTQLEAGSTTTDPPQESMDPWNFTEYRVRTKYSSWNALIDLSCIG